MTDRYKTPFEDLREALFNAGPAGPVTDEQSISGIRIDPHRARRTGIPEVVHGGNKSPQAIGIALSQLAAANGRAMASRVDPASIGAIVDALGAVFEVEEHPEARSLVAFQIGAPRPETGGRIGVLSAGTSDVPIAAEAALIAAEMGASVFTGWDVGVAGLHRLVAPLQQFAEAAVDAIVVAAGMDGALPSVVSGLVDVPVIGLPTSNGYGLGGQGLGALTTMLQSCAPGLVVVNIDNGIGAGSTAALIANRAASLRRRARED